MKRIITAVDGSRSAQRAVEAAGDLARTYGAELHLVHVVGSGAVPPALARMAEVEHLTETPRPSSAGGDVANVFGNLAMAARSPDSPAVAREIHQAIGERLLQKAAALARDNGAGAVEVMLRDGHPAREIVNAAEQINADLIVLGTRGLSEIKGLLLGSVSHRVIQLAPCSCLVIK